MRGLVLCAALPLAACSGHADAPQLSVSHARIVTRGGQAVLHAGLAYQPSAVQLDALQHGVPLSLRLVVGDGADDQALDIQLRYFPLSRRYQLHTAPGTDRSFAVRGYLLDALQRLRLPLVANPCVSGTLCALEVTADPARLPGALRLPALLHSAWHVPAASATVTQVGS